MTNRANGPDHAGAWTPVPNTLLSGDGFFVSHNDVDLSIYGCETTALVKGQMELFLILDGDHRQAYAERVPQGYEACLAYFEDHPELVNKRSDRPAPRVAAPPEDDADAPSPFSP